MCEEGRGECVLPATAPAWPPLLTSIGKETFEAHTTPHTQGPEPQLQEWVGRGNSLLLQAVEMRVVVWGYTKVQVSARSWGPSVVQDWTG